jgi:proteasome accessory factor C
MSEQVGTAARLRRLLAILAWLAQVGEAPIDQVAARFDLSPDALVTDLEMAACCGVPPYTPDQLMEIVVTDSTVATWPGTVLARPRRLSPSEGFALSASGRALLAVPGSDDNGALSRALAKLDRALGGEEIAVELVTPPHLAVVREAADQGRPLSVTYYSASTDRITDREIVPHRVFSSEGRWYVDATSQPTGDERRFRIDRMVAAELVTRPSAGSAGDASSDRPGSEDRIDGTRSSPRDDSDLDLRPFVPGPDSRRVRLSVDPSAAWLLESVPSATRPETDGHRVEVELHVGGTAWLERLLLRLGPDARVIDPPELATLASGAARRILRRYQDPATTSAP